MMNMPYEVVDSFLDEKIFNHVSETMLNWNFPWYLNSFDSEETAIAAGAYFNPGDAGLQFSSVIYYQGIKNEIFHSLRPILEELEVKELLDIRARLMTKTSEIMSFQYHTDHDPEAMPEGATTAVLYLNDNNGYTYFKQDPDTHIVSKANRVLIFDNYETHAGTTCSDAKLRALLNFNFIR